MCVCVFSPVIHAKTPLVFLLLCLSYSFSLSRSVCVCVFVFVCACVCNTHKPFRLKDSKDKHTTMAAGRVVTYQRETRERDYMSSRKRERERGREECTARLSTSCALRCQHPLRLHTPRRPDEGAPSLNL